MARAPTASGASPLCECPQMPPSPSTRWGLSTLTGAAEDPPWADRPRRGWLRCSNRRQRGPPTIPSPYFMMAVVGIVEWLTRESRHSYIISSLLHCRVLLSCLICRESLDRPSLTATLIVDFVYALIIFFLQGNTSQAIIPVAAYGHLRLIFLSFLWRKRRSTLEWHTTRPNPQASVSRAPRFVAINTRPNSMTSHVARVNSCLLLATCLFCAKA